MLHKVKVTVLDKKLYPELQAQYCADPHSGACPCYNVGDEYIFERYGSADDFWHMGINTLTHCTGDAKLTAGGSKLPHCSEAWDAISRYIYTGLQGGSIMHGWMNDDRIMITCCSDGTRPVIFKIERQDYFAVWFKGIGSDADREQIRQLLCAAEGVTSVLFRNASDGAGEFAEVYAESSVSTEDILNAVNGQQNIHIVRVD